MPKQSDRLAELIRRQDHRGALTECEKRYGAALGRFCLSLLGRQEDAEEAVQETLLAAYRGFASWRGEGSPRSWLFGIARRQAARVGEKRNRAQHLQLVPDDVASSADTAEELAGARRASRVRAALSRLKPSERDALLLRYQAGLSYAEIANVCSVTEEAARKRASRGLARLRSTLSSEEIR